MDGPKQVDHVHGVFDRRAEANDRKRADGAQCDHQVGLERHDDGRNKIRDNCHGRVELLGIKTAL